MILNLVADRVRGWRSNQSAIRNPKSEIEMLSRTVFPETLGTERREAENVAAAVPDTERRKQSLLVGFEEMLSAYAKLVMRDLRN